MEENEREALAIGYVKLGKLFNLLSCSTPTQRKTKKSPLIADAEQLFRSFVDDDLITGENVAVSLFL